MLQLENLTIIPQCDWQHNPRPAMGQHMFVPVQVAVQATLAQACQGQCQVSHPLAGAFLGRWKEAKGRGRPEQGREGGVAGGWHRKGRRSWNAAVILDPNPCPRLCTPNLGPAGAWTWINSRHRSKELHWLS